MQQRTLKGHNEYGKALVKALEKRNMSNTDLCVETGISASTIHRLIRGLGTQSSKTTKKIAKVLPELEIFITEY